MRLQLTDTESVFTYTYENDMTLFEIEAISSKDYQRYPSGPFVIGIYTLNESPKDFLLGMVRHFQYLYPSSDADTAQHIRKVLKANNPKIPMAMTYGMIKGHEILINRAGLITDLKIDEYYSISTINDSLQLAYDKETANATT